MAQGVAEHMRRALDALSRLCAQAENGGTLDPKLPQAVHAHIQLASLDLENVAEQPQGLPSAMSQPLLACRKVLTAYTEQKILEASKRHLEQAARLLGGLPGLTGDARETTVAYAATAGLLVSGILQSAAGSLEFYRSVVSVAPALNAVAPLVHSLLDDICDPGLLRSLLNIFPSIRQCINQITSDSSPAREWTNACYSAYGALLGGCSSLSKAILDAATSDITLHTAASRGSSSGQRRSPALPPRAASVLDNLLGADWLAGVSRALLETPALPASLAPDALFCVRRAGYLLAESLVSLHQVMSSMVVVLGGGSSHAVAPLLSRVCVLAVQPDVVRAQRELLRRLLVHGGVQVPPAPPPTPASRKAARQRAAAEAAAGAAAPEQQPGAWALTEAEQQMGRAVHDPYLTLAGEWVRQLEAEHVCVLHATLGLWRALHEHKAGSGAHPSPAAVLPSYGEMAALGLAAAKAFRRLQLGQGLGGAFRSDAVPPAAALLPRNAVLMTNCAWDGGEDSDAMGAAELVTCLPYWLEAKGHLLAMAADCVEGGREPELMAQARYDGRVSVLQLESMYGTAADGTVSLLDQAQDLLTKALFTLPPSATAALASRLAAGRLLPGLDHALRLALRGALHYELRPHEAPDEDEDPLLLIAGALAPLTQMFSDEALATGGSGGAGRGGGGGGGDSGGGVGQAGQDGCGDVREQLVGLLVTAAKRARQLTGELEALPLPALAPAEQQGQGQARRWVASVLGAAEALELLQACMAAAAAALNVEAGVRGRQGSGSMGGSGGFLPALEEAAAFSLRCGCALATQLMHHLAHHLAAQGGRGGSGRGRAGAGAGALPRAEAARLADAGAQMLNMVNVLASLPPACISWRQLLAAQPQRLAAACCEVLSAAAGQGAEGAAGRRGGGGGGALDPDANQRIACGVCCSIVMLATREELRPYVKAWLAPKAAAGGGGGAASYAAALVAGGEAGWSDGVVDDEALVRMAGAMPVYAGLLHQVRQAARASTATGQGGGGGGGEDGGGDGDDFSMAVLVSAGTLQDPQRFAVSSQVAQPGPTTQKVRQDLKQERARTGGGGSGGLARPRAEVPPALCGDAVAVPCRRVRVCGNPGCGNFAGGAEAGLELKQCGGCKAVRYCGPDCQRAHWRGAHKEECKELQRHG